MIHPYAIQLLSEYSSLACLFACPLYSIINIDLVLLLDNMLAKAGALREVSECALIQGIVDGGSMIKEALKLGTADS